MGNCQAVDAAALAIQHPSGKMEMMYSSVLASEVMNNNPGHYVSIIIPLPTSGEAENNTYETKKVKFSRVKLLKPCDVLVLGRAYRLVTSQEVSRVLRAKRNAKLKKKQHELHDTLKIRNSDHEEAEDKKLGKNDQVRRGHEINRQSPAMSSNTIPTRSKMWRPSLQSISESGS